MSVRWLMGLSLAWIVAHGILGGIISGVYLGDAETNIVNQMAYYNIMESQGIWAIPSICWQFLRDLPNLLSFNYPFLTGGYAIARVVFGAIGIGIVWGLIQTFGPALQGMASSLLRIGR